MISARRYRRTRPLVPDIKLGLSFTKSVPLSLKTDQATLERKTNAIDAFVALTCVNAVVAAATSGGCWSQDRNRPGDAAVAGRRLALSPVAGYRSIHPSLRSLASVCLHIRIGGTGLTPRSNRLHEHPPFRLSRGSRSEQN